MIGGRDHILKVPDVGLFGVPTVDDIIHMTVGRHWPDMVRVGSYEPVPKSSVVPLGRIQEADVEYFLFRDAETAERMDKEGVTPETDDLMLHVLHPASALTGPLEVTIVSGPTSRPIVRDVAEALGAEIEPWSQPGLLIGYVVAKGFVDERGDVVLRWQDAAVLPGIVDWHTAAILSMAAILLDAIESHDAERLEPCRTIRECLEAELGRVPDHIRYKYRIATQAITAYDVATAPMS